MKRCLLLFFILFSAFAFAENMDQQIDQLKSKIKQATYYDSSSVFRLGKECISLAKKAHREKEIGQVYQYYGNFFYYSNDFERAKYYYEKSIVFAKKWKDRKLVNSSKIRLAFILMENDLRKGEKEFRKLLVEAKKGAFIENQIEIYNGLGIMYETRMRDDKAVHCYLNGLKISEKHHKDYFTGFLLNNLGLLKLENKNYKGAKQDLEKGLRLATRANEPRLRFNILNNLGLVNKKSGDFKASIKFYKQNVHEAKAIGFPMNLTTAYINLTSSYLDDDQINEAQKCLDSAEALLSDKMPPNFLVAAQLMRGLVSIEIKDFSRAELSVKNAQNYLNAYQDPTQLPELRLLQAKLAEAKGDYKLAYQFEREFHELTDSLREVSNEEELNRLESLFNKERMENEMVTLNQRNEILQTQNKLKSTNLRFIIILVFSLFIVVLGAIYIYQIRKSRKVKAYFSQKIIEQLDQERSRISKDLHDDIGQSLAVVKSKLNLFLTGKIQTVEGVDGDVGDILEQTRKLSHQLHPAGIEKLGLRDSLRSLIDKTQSATNLICSFDYEIEDKVFEISVASQLYRIIQECLSNTIKHANATALKISFEKKNSELMIEYRDNGIGFNEQHSKIGIGLLTISERVAIIGGKLEVKSNRDKGTQLTITI